MILTGFSKDKCSSIDSVGLELRKKKFLLAIDCIAAMYANEE